MVDSSRLDSTRFGRPCSPRLTHATIRPKRRSYLAFKVEGHYVMVKVVRIPKRPIWEPTLKENAPKIREMFRKSVVGVMQ